MYGAASNQRSTATIRLNQIYEQYFGIRYIILIIAHLCNNLSVSKLVYLLAYGSFDTMYEIASTWSEFCGGGFTPDNTLFLNVVRIDFV